MSVLLSPRDAKTTLAAELASPRTARTCMGQLVSARDAKTTLLGAELSSPRDALTRLWTAEFAGYFLDGDLA